MPAFSRSSRKKPEKKIFRGSGSAKRQSKVGIKSRSARGTDNAAPKESKARSGSLPTKIKNAEKTLKDSEFRFRGLVDNMSSGVVVYKVFGNGRDFIFKDFNKAAERIEGIRKEDVLGKSVLKVFPGVRKFGLLDVFKRVWKTGKPEHHPVSMYSDNRIVGWRNNYVYRLHSSEIVAVYDDVTKQKQAEIELKESEENYRNMFENMKKAENASLESQERFRTLFDNASDAMFIHDMQGRFLEVNQVACQRLGYARDELLKMSTKDIESLEFVGLVPERLNTIRKKGNLIFETTHIAKNGTRIPIELSSKVINFSGKPAVLSIARDITERKKAEEALRESENKYRILVDNAPAGVYKTKITGEFIFANQALANMLEYDSPKEMMSQNATSFYQTPEDRNKLVKTLQEHGRITSFDAKLRTKSGKYKDIMISAVLEGDEISGMMRDMTERKKAEQALQDSEARLRTIFEGAPIGIAVIDMDGHILVTNPVLQNMFGYDTKELHKKLMRELTHPDDLVVSQELSEELLSGKRDSYNMDRRYIKKDGTIVWGRLVVSLARDEKGDPLFSIGMVEDITEQKKTEEALRASKEFLGKIIDTIGDPVFVKDWQHRWVLLNDAYCTFMGYGKEQL
ncbi:MAG: PAS domain S-box protein, partial [Candidatus Altiarchaeota archaeon]|nr:PAS domain S-box protein [Candidatus Altiarchaeota archaeon]